MTLTSVREINNACYAAANGRGGYVFCDHQDQEQRRIIGARTRKGVLQVHLLNSGEWVTPRKVWKDQR
ncbi:MAG TPA: hypothetical protein VGN34_27640 [Ktedonobacteraceae bacterium]